MLFFALKTELKKKVASDLTSLLKITCPGRFYVILLISTKFMVNHVKPDRVVRVTTLYCRVSRFWQKFLRNVFFQVRLTQLLKRSSTISIFLKSDKFLLRNDLFSPANQAVTVIFFSGTDKSSSKLWVYMVVVWSNKSEAELGETGRFFQTKTYLRKVFLTIWKICESDLCPIHVSL